ncbi:MAG: hypothetical protein WC718_16445 [Phycisphaerales bacterium]|jgi:hypothetical protein
MKTFRLGRVQCQVPDGFDVAAEDDSTVVTASDRGFQFRLSAIGVMKSGVLVPDAGRRYVEDRGRKEQREIVKKEEKVWFSFPDTAIGGEEDTATWYVGIDTHVIIISAWIVSPADTTPASIAECVVATIGTLALLPPEPNHESSAAP